MTPAELAERLDRFVRPDTFPLAIRMLKDGEAIPEKTKSPRRDLGVEVATCQSYAIARRYGWTLAVTRDDINCPLTRIAYGFDPEAPSYTSGEMCEGMYNATKEAGARTEAEVPKFPPGTYQAILVGPLARASYEPHVVLVYGSSAQVMILLAASLHRSGGYLTCRFSPRIDCSESVVRTMQTGEPQVILPCYGDRVVGQAQDHEMAFSIPWARAAEIGEALEALHKGGVRYPIPSFLRFQPEFPPKYRALDEELRARRGEDKPGSGPETQ